jgi:rubrerythrin
MNMTSDLKTALSLEKASQRYFTDLARHSNNHEMAQTFSFLANEEANHFRNLLSLSEERQLRSAHSLHAGRHARRLFRKFAEEARGSPTMMDSDRALHLALQLKLKGLALFCGLLESIDLSKKAALDRMIDEERRRADLYEQLSEIAQTPKVWLDNAEVNHLEEY